MSSFTEDLAVGVADYIAAHSAVAMTWRSSGIYAPTDPWPITVGRMAPNPSQVASVAPWGGSVVDPALADWTQPVQLKFRGNGDTSTSVNEAADAVFDILDNQLRGLVVNGVHVVLVAQANSIPMGIDDHGRYMRSDNYNWHVNRPTAGRPF